MSSVRCEGFAGESDEEPVVHTNASMAIKNDIMDHVSHTAGRARRTQTLKKTDVSDLWASYAYNQGINDTF